MHKKLAVWFLFVALVYLLVGLLVPQLQPDPLWQVALVIPCYVVVGLGAAWLVSGLLTRRLRDLATAAAAISKGDLTLQVDTSGDDETALVARAFRVMSDSLLSIVLEVHEVADQINRSAQSLSMTAEQVNAATEGIASTARSIADGAGEQARQVAETSSITRELADSIDRVAEQAQTVHRAASRASELTAVGVQDARRAALGIGQLAEKTAAAKAAVEGFKVKAGEIGSIVSSITSISHQTHLLAINAAIEAARVDEQGQGFSVVAEEVSRLADNVRGCAAEISEISGEIMRGSQALADGIRESIGSADDALEVVRRTAGAFDDLLGTVRGTSERAGEISALTREQKRLPTRWSGPWNGYRGSPTATSAAPRTRFTPRSGRSRRCTGWPTRRACSRAHRTSSTT
jgi:methyl-accepting chemotaxis protein